MLKRFVFNVFDWTSEEKRLLEQKVIYASDLQQAYELLASIPKANLKQPFMKIKIEYFGVLDD